MSAVVDVDDPEPLVEAAGPFEIVEEAPDEVPIYHDTFSADLFDLVDVCGEVCGASCIVNVPVW